MKKKSFFRAVLSVLVILSMLASIPVFAEEVSGEQQYTITEPYEYPVVPGTPEWEALGGQMEMVNATQIPIEILSQLTTKAVLTTVLNHPLSWQIYVYDTLEKGYNAISNKFNVIQELEQRPDASTVLLEEYKNLLLEGNEEVNRCTLNDLEVFLAQRIYLEKFTDNEIEELNTFITRRQDMRAEEGKTYSFFYSALSDEISTFTFPFDYSYVETTIKTPQGESVPAYKFTEELNGDDYSDAIWKMDQYSSRITVLRPPTTKYNCHSYAWYSQSSNNSIWLNDASPFISCYTQNYGEPRVGDRVYYSADDHSGIITSKSGELWVTSKWAQMGLVKHPIGYCPYDNGQYEYYN